MSRYLSWVFDYEVDSGAARPYGRNAERGAMGMIQLAGVAANNGVNGGILSPCQSYGSVWLHTFQVYVVLVEGPDAVEKARTRIGTCPNVIASFEWIEEECARDVWRRGSPSSGSSPKSILHALDAATARTSTHRAVHGLCFNGAMTISRFGVGFREEIPK